MKKKVLILISYIILILNSNLLKADENKILKVGLLAPLTGQYEELGNSLLYSLQLALSEIDDENVFIIPRDAGFNNKEKLRKAIQSFEEQNVSIVIGPISYQDFDEAKKFSNITFISPSNISPEFGNNIISVGISLDSQLKTLEKFIKKQKKNKTVIMFPDNQYKPLIEKKMKTLNLNNLKTFTYNPNPEVLTGDIEILTNYSQKKKIYH